MSLSGRVVAYCVALVVSPMDGWMESFERLSNRRGWTDVVAINLENGVFSCCSSRWSLASSGGSRHGA